MKRYGKKLISQLAVLALAGSLGALNAFAADPAPQPAANTYKYTVRVYAGGLGAFSEGDSAVHVHEDLEYGAEVDGYDSSTFKVSDSRYYVKGLRRSGRDRGDIAEGALTWQVIADGDCDYVVSYAVAGNLVEYRVRYLEAGSNAELHAPDTFYGNIGDRPIVSYRQIDGYVPQAYNITRELRENQDNTITFYYTRGGGVQYLDETVTDEGVTVVEIPGAVTGAAGAAGGGGGGAGGAGGGAAAGPGAGAAVVGPDAGPGAAGDQGGVAINPDDTPQTLLDLDEDQTALGNLTLDEDTTNRMGLFGGIVAAMAGVAGLGWLVWFLLARRRRRDEDEA